MTEPLQSPPDGRGYTGLIDRLSRGLLQSPFVQGFLRTPWVQRLLRSGEVWTALAADQDRSAPSPGPEAPAPFPAPITRPAGNLGTLWQGTKQVAQGLWQITERLGSVSLRAARTAWALRSEKAFQKALDEHAEHTGRQPDYSAGQNSQTRPGTGASRKVSASDQAPSPLTRNIGSIPSAAHEAFASAGNVLAGAAGLPPPHDPTQRYSGDQLGSRAAAPYSAGQHWNANRSPLQPGGAQATAAGVTVGDDQRKSGRAEIPADQPGGSSELSNSSTAFGASMAPIPPSSAQKLRSGAPNAASRPSLPARTSVGKGPRR